MASEEVIKNFVERFAQADLNDRIETEGYQAVVIHPTADDVDFLRRYRMKPSDCISVDCWWLCADRVFLVEVSGRGYIDREPGIYYRSDKRRRRENIQVSLEKPYITMECLLAVLGDLAARVDSGAFNKPSKDARFVADLPDVIAGP